jgi:dolichol kinase/phosphoserine phosphatase
MEQKSSPQKNTYRGLIVLDVDGVLFKDIFLKKIVQSKGVASYFKILLLGIKYYIEKISLDTLLVEGYRLAGRFDRKKAQVTADRIRRVTNIKETVNILHREGFFISLMSAGIPDYVLKNLSGEIGADHYAGIDISVDPDRLTAPRIEAISKIEVVETLLEELNLTWGDVVSVADDPNNVELLQKSGKGIGFNPSLPVRKHSDVVIEGNNFLEILPHIVPAECLEKKYGRSRFIWKREFFRKSIHVTGSIFPFIAHQHRTIALAVLGGVIFLYLLSEILRLLGVSIVFLSYITKRAQRGVETRGIIFGPVLLALGMILTIIIFDYRVYLPAILIVSISDTISALVGLRFGRIRIFGLKNRTVIGSTLFFLSAAVILFLTLSASSMTAISTTSSSMTALILTTAVIAALIELIPFYNIDNFFIPVVTATFLHFVVKG